MMRPEIPHKKDVIDEMLDQSWENPADELVFQLKAIPKQISMVQNQHLDRFSILLNTILLLWGMGLIMYFWTPLDSLLSIFSRTILGYSSLSPGILSQPLIMGFALVCFLLGWIWLDTEKRPRVSRLK